MLVMQRTLALILLVLSAAPASAGMTYRFESVTTGPVSHRMAGTVRAEGSAMRVDISKGDGVTFRDGSFILATGPSAPLLVVDPAGKKYFELRPEELAAGSALRSLTAMFGLQVQNEKVSSRDAGAGGRVAGFDTRRGITSSSFDLLLEGMGQTMRAKVSIVVQSWTTDRIPQSMTNVLQMRGVKTGLAAIDRLIAAQSQSTKGFPLRQISTIRFNDTVATTTTTVSDVRTTAVPAALFALPKGLTKVSSPLK